MRRSSSGIKAPPARPPLHPDALTRFVDALPTPPILRPDGQRADPTDATRLLPTIASRCARPTCACTGICLPRACGPMAGAFLGPPSSGGGAATAFLSNGPNELPMRHLFPVDHGVCVRRRRFARRVRTVVHVHFGAKGSARERRVPGKPGTARDIRPSSTIRTNRTPRRSGTRRSHDGHRAAQPICRLAGDVRSDPRRRRRCARPAPRVFSPRSPSHAHRTVSSTPCWPARPIRPPGDPEAPWVPGESSPGQTRSS